MTIGHVLKIAHLQFADDMYLVTNSMHELRIMLGELETCLQAIGLNFAGKKLAWTTNAECDKDTVIPWSGGVVKFKPALEVLGNIVCPKGSTTVDCLFHTAWLMALQNA